MSLHTLVQDAADRLEASDLSYGHGTTNAWDEAAWLVLWQLGLPLDTALNAPEAPTPTDLQIAQCHALILHSPLPPLVPSTPSLLQICRNRRDE